MAAQIEQHIMKAEQFHQTQWKSPFPETLTADMSDKLYRIRPLTKSDGPRTLEFLRKFFFRDEPLNINVKLLGEDGRDPCSELDEYCLKSLEETYSIAAITPSGDIIGVCLNGAHEPGHMEEIDENADDCPNPKFKKILKLLATVERKADIFGRYPTLKKLMEIRVLSVDNNYRGQGIATELINATIELAKKNNFKMIRADCTSYFSARAMARLGSQCIFEMPYATYCDGEKRPIFDPELPHTSVSTYILRLS